MPLTLDIYNKHANKKDGIPQPLYQNAHKEDDNDDEVKVETTRDDVGTITTYDAWWNQ